MFDPIIIFYLITLVFSAVIHEYMHGWMADYLGDPTARNEGRLTLNPLKHIDPMMTIFMPIVTYLLFKIPIGGAKPVPFNPYNLRDQQFGSAKVAGAGPLANFVVAIVFGMILRFFPAPNEMFITLLSIIVQLNLLLMIFNLLPIPPLDGSKILIAFLPYKWQIKFMQLEGFGLIFVYLFVVFLSPVIIYLLNLLYYLIVIYSF